VTAALSEPLGLEGEKALKTAQAFGGGFADLCAKFFSDAAFILEQILVPSRGIV
jgi:hypothetical protein